MDRNEMGKLTDITTLDDEVRRYMAQHIDPPIMWSDREAESAAIKIGSFEIKSNGVRHQVIIDGQQQRAVTKVVLTLEVGELAKVHIERLCLPEHGYGDTT